MNQVAYVTYEGVIYVGDPGVSEGSPLTPQDISCTWPTWCRDSSRFAFSGFRSGHNGHGQLGLYLQESLGKQPQLIYANEPGTDAIARKTPHYAVWSPNGKRLAFIAQSRSGGLALFVHDVSGPGQPERLGDGGPLYMSWSADSRFLLAHSHRAHFLVDFERGRDLRQMPGTSSLYMAPSWDPNSNRMAICRDAGDGAQKLLVADVNDGTVRTVAEIAGAGAFAWRPDGRSIGLVREANERSGYYNGIWQVDVDSGRAERVTDDRALCFFWSLDGSKIAYITPSEGADGSVRWGILNVEERTTRYLADFRPTQEQLTTFMFFDQYAQSHSPWSPDGGQLVFSGELGYQMARSTLPEGPFTGVFVGDVTAATPPKQVAHGVLGTWARA